jgi:hypothetical protein
MKPITAGSEIDAWCTKCRMNLGHRVVAMLQGRPKRVLCQTCGSEHNYRKEKGASDVSPIRRGGEPARSASSKDAPARGKARRENDWEAHVLGHAVSAFTRYSTVASLKQGELVLHSKFGEGYVTELVEGGKVNIMFRDGERTLVHQQT